MRFPYVVAAELRKTLTLPAALVALAVAVLGPAGVTLLNALSIRSVLRAGRPELTAYSTAAEAVLSAVPLGAVGAVVLGVVAMGSEYTANSTRTGGGRQITTTLTATTGRVTVLAAKATAVVLLVAAAAVVAIPASLALAGGILGTDGTPGPADAPARLVGAGVYWALTALIALAVTVFTRSGIIPVIVLVANSSLVSVSYLLSHLTPLARYLPDLAGASLFAGDLLALDNALAPLAGGLVMAAWTAGLLVLAGVVFARRDA
ncbi:hypothetical protein QQG74_19495 [Micromonospora sp. FIMYZ51]|uniref:hypothetical protein n=1 Tax=Micromonospora sp. FIMYZ51 TaxID=3051832 RepID=UPI00311F2884